MTANTSTANNTENNKDKTPAVDADVASTETTPETEAPAKDENTVAKRDEQTVKAEMTAKQSVALDDLKREHAQALETNGHYHDWGFVYAAPAPIANAIGAELGLMQRDDKTMTVQRTGIGFYLRSDHVSDIKLNACTTRI